MAENDRFSTFRIQASNCSMSNYPTNIPVIWAVVVAQLAD